MKKKKNGMAYAYLAPTLITILLVTCLPILYTVILSFTNYNMYHLGDYTFVGADNYLTVFPGVLKVCFSRCLGGRYVLRYSVRWVPMLWDCCWQFF